MRQLTPMIVRESYYAEIEREINAFYGSLFAKLLAAFREEGLELQNAKGQTALGKALASGRCWYSEGRIYGSFTAAISKDLRAIGGRYSLRTKSWAVDMLPPDLQIAVAQADSRARDVQSRIIKTLDDFDADRAIKATNLAPAYDKTLQRIGDDFAKLTNKISVAPQLPPARVKTLAKEWGENLDLYVKGWADESIIDMRKKISANTFKGQRAENMEKVIMQQYGASKAKAKFLARQETSLLMSKYQEERFKDIGITHYKWSGADDQRERPDHKLLNGKIFRFDDPPVTNRSTGAKNNPGEDFNCRCIAIAIVDM